MTAILEKYDLLRKPKPKEKESIGIQIAQMKEGVKINVPITENINEGLNRDEILKNLQGVLTVKPEGRRDDTEKVVQEPLLKSKLSPIEEERDEMVRDDMVKDVKSKEVPVESVEES